MAKITKTMAFNNAMIDLNEMEIVEYSKDGDINETFSLMEVLSQWDGVMGITLTIKQAGEISADGGEAE